MEPPAADVLMALVFCEVSGVPVRTLTLTLPARGCWLADAFLDRPAAALKGSVTLALAGLSLSGTIYRAVDLTGTGMIRIVGGAGISSLMSSASPMSSASLMSSASAGGAPGAGGGAAFASAASWAAFAASSNG